MTTRHFVRAPLLLLIAAIGWLVAAVPRADGRTTAAPIARRYFALPLAAAGESLVLVRGGIPFQSGSLDLSDGGSREIPVGAAAQRLYILGLTHSGEKRPPLWPDPNNREKQFFLGDELGRIRIAYADGTNEDFPLVLGESGWWGKLFVDNPEPFGTSARFRSALAGSLRLYPAAPLVDGNYVAVIEPRAKEIAAVTVIDNAAKYGHPIINGLTVAATAEVPHATVLAAGGEDPAFEAWAARHPLRRAGEAADEAAHALETLRATLYTSEQSIPASIPVSRPTGYTGPVVSFTGPPTAAILANAFAANVQDIADKVDATGMYHTSTKGAPNWGRYVGFGTYRPGLGRYYDESWSRDLGRSLQELTELGYLSEAARCADWCLAMARRWETDTPRMRLNGSELPRHWSRIINQPSLEQGPLENDGHGLIGLFLYKLWQRLPERTAWLRSRWADVEAAGDWIDWQFQHPQVTGATATLHTTSECAAMDGHSVYADEACREMLAGFADMADSIGEPETAARWRNRADFLRRGMAADYVVRDAHGAPAWTLVSAGWSHRSSVLGPLILHADRAGFLSTDNPWQPVNAGSYRALVQRYQPFGFYGSGMGYGQGFVTQAALLLDRMADATTMLDWTAREIFDPQTGSYIVPEGCLLDPTGRYWYRFGDLGNGVQEAEIVKALRIVVGIDDAEPDHPRLCPRLPWGWSGIRVERYPMLVAAAQGPTVVRVKYLLGREPNGLTMSVAADHQTGPIAFRLGPFRQPPTALTLNGDVRSVHPVRSGDAWWVMCTSRLGLEPTELRVRGE